MGVQIFMLLNKYYFLTIALGFVLVSGCTGYLEKELYLRKIPITQVGTIKNKIISEGYEKVGAEDVQWEGAIRSNYAKDISTQAVENKVLIHLSFKMAEPPGNYYRNMGITVSSLGQGETNEMKAEIFRMEEVLYKKLIEVVGEENVVRGLPKSK
jgi:hypothetical protein